MENRQEDRDQVVILFQDMLEVVTRDIMDEQISGYEILPHLFNVMSFETMHCTTLDSFGCQYYWGSYLGLLRYFIYRLLQTIMAYFLVFPQLLCCLN